MPTTVKVERDTNSDYALIQSQKRLMGGLVYATSKVEGCSLETAEYALSLAPELAIDIDYDPPLDSNWTAVLEEYWGQRLGGREDVRIAGMRISPRYCLVGLGLGNSGYEAEIIHTPDWIVNSFHERAVSPLVFINLQTGIDLMETVSAKNYVTGKRKISDWSLSIAILPTQIFTALTNILNEEDPFRMKLMVSSEKELRQLTTKPFNISRHDLEQKLELKRLWAS